MAQLSLLFCLLPAFLWAQSVQKLSLQTISSTEKVGKHRYGGISSLNFSDGILWALSDDRGSLGPARLYKQSLEKEKVKPLAEVVLGDLPGYSILDTEALVRFKDGRFLISSEGDFNKKPRVMPFIRFWDEKKKWEKLEIPLNADLLPEKTGMQSKGLQNNSAFEAMALSADEKTLFLISEVPLFQNQNSECEWLEFQIKDGIWSQLRRKAYKRDLAPEGALEVMRGVSEALYWKKDHLLVLERWVRLDKTRAVVIGAELFSVNTNDLKKKKLFTLEGDLAANWEGMAWGPDLSDGRKQLILVSDNNFEKKTPTQYLFLAVKEESK